MQIGPEQIFSDIDLDYKMETLPGDTMRITISHIRQEGF
jgi:hypothetical protein